MIAVATLLSAMQVALPMTVNDQSLGAPATFTSAGPAKVCLREMAVTFKHGETAALTYSGIHYGTLRLADGKRFVDFEHGESWSTPRRKTFLLKDENGYEIYRSRKDGKLAYAVFDSFLGGKPAFRVWITGTALTGRLDDARWLRSMSLTKHEPHGCDRVYDYGCGVLLGTAPLIKQP